MENFSPRSKTSPLLTKVMFLFIILNMQWMICIGNLFKGDCIIQRENIKTVGIKMPDAQTQCRPMDRSGLHFLFLGSADRTASRTGETIFMRLQNRILTHFD